MQVRLDERLREHGMGSWEGLTRAEVEERFPEQYADWMAGRPVRGRGGEDPVAVGERAVAALADLPPAAVAVVVTHGGTSGRLIERLLGLGSDHRRVFGPLGNCAWSELSCRATAGGCCGTTSRCSAAPAGASRGSGRCPRPMPRRPRRPRPSASGDADAV